MRLHIEQIIAIALLMQSDRNDGSLDGSYMSEAVMKKMDPRLNLESGALEEETLATAPALPVKNILKRLKRIFFVR